MRISLLHVPWHRRWLRDQRGQNIVLASLLLLFVFMAVMVTFSIGYRTREKIKLQALADSGAYSTAVAEARLFNFFAWTNRAHVAHDVAILSIHSHASYITFQESLFEAASKAMKQIRIQMYAWCAVCFWSGACCQSCSNAGKFGQAANEFWGSSFWEGKWLHEQWHQSSTWDKMLMGPMGASKLHYLAIQALQAEQIYLLGLAATKFATIPETAAKKVDPDINGGTMAALASANNMNNVIAFMGENSSDDWKEIVSATRENDWLYKRSFQWNGGWLLTYGMATMKLLPCFALIVPSESGNSKTTKSVSSMGSLSSAIHNGSDSDEGWGRAKGYGAEDHGSTNPVVGICDCPGIGYSSAKGGVLSGPQQESIPQHFFHSGAGCQDKTSTHDIGGCSRGECGVWWRHPRYKYGEEDFDDDKLWGQPHNIVVLKKSIGSMPKQVFDFDVQLGLPFPVHFQTKGNRGDQDANNEMAAVAGGLVYYHKPQNSGDNWKEPPSFWNPYWRAKLHPLRRSDLELALPVDHRASAFLANAYVVGAY